MKKKNLVFSNFNDIFDLLIREEQKAIEVYNSMARRSENLESRKAFEQFARDKTGHVIELKAHRKHYPAEDFPNPLHVKVSNISRQANGLKRMNYSDIIAFAIEEESKSEGLYQSIADQLEDGEIVHLFNLFSREEKKHRQRMEKMLRFGE